MECSRRRRDRPSRTRRGRPVRVHVDVRRAAGGSPGTRRCLRCGRRGPCCDQGCPGCSGGVQLRPGMVVGVQFLLCPGGVGRRLCDRPLRPFHLLFRGAAARRAGDDSRPRRSGPLDTYPLPWWRSPLASGFAAGVVSTDRVVGLPVRPRHRALAPAATRADNGPRAPLPGPGRPGSRRRRFPVDCMDTFTTSRSWCGSGLQSTLRPVAGKRVPDRARPLLLAPAIGAAFCAHVGQGAGLPVRPRGARRTAGCGFAPAGAARGGGDRPAPVRHLFHGPGPAVPRRFGDARLRSSGAVDYGCRWRRGATGSSVASGFGCVRRLPRPRGRP